MPVISGLEICKQLKSDEDTKDVPVLFITASTDAKVLKEAFDSGGTDYVSKPLNRIELMVRIRSALAQGMLLKKILSEEKMKGVFEMSGAVCHELNQPLQFISSAAELLLMEIGSDDPMFKMVTNIAEHVKRLGDITQKLMFINKYETKEYIKGAKIIDIDKSSPGGAKSGKWIK